MSTKYFLNLTNGIEFLKSRDIGDCSFIRLQSTLCEQKHWLQILQDIDYNFLMCLALGYHCVVVDYSANKEVPRSVYQGLEWIKFVLNRVWFVREYKPIVRGVNCLYYFRKQYSMVKDDKVIKRIKYFRKFLMVDAISLDAYTSRTQHDGDTAYYKELLSVA